MIWYTLPVELHDIDERLHNWGRWASTKPRYRIAQSAEGKYRRPAAEDDPRRNPTPVTDVFDASAVDAALAPANGFPRVFSRLLVLHYVHRVSDRTTRRLVRVPVSEWDWTVRSALFAARNRLERTNV